MIFFFWVVIEQIKKEKFSALDIVNHGVKRCGRFHEHKFLYLDDQYFYF